MDPDKNKAGGGDGGGGNEPITVEKLQEQLENLNKGIAKYRDEAKLSSEEAKAAKIALAEQKSEVERIKAAIEAAKSSEDDEENEKLKLAPADQKKLEKWAKDHGFVSQKDLEAERTKVFAESLKNIEAQAVDEFLKSYPEINKDEEWNKVKEQFGLYRQPTSLAGYRQVLEKIHKDLYGSDDKTAQARAKVEERKRLSLGGGSQKADGDDDLVEKYAEKYPNLSREQIVSRIEEINKIAKERDERRKTRKK